MIILFEHDQTRWFKISLPDELGLKAMRLRSFTDFISQVNKECQRRKKLTK